jgi:hypothetical protein
MRTWLLVLAALSMLHIGLASPAVAQTPALAATIPRFEISAGYQLLLVTDEPGSMFPSGLAVDAAANVGAFAFVAEGGWSFRSEGNEPDDVRFDFWHAGAGPRWTMRKHPRVWPYAQALVGATFHVTSGHIAGTDQSDRTAHLMVQPGGGVTVVVGDRWSLLGAVDYRWVLLDEDTEGESGLNEVRVLAGVRLRFN